MATVSTAITSTAFVEISTAADALIHNSNRTPILVVFDATLPAVGAAAIILESGEGLQKIAGKPVGNVYARMAYEGGVGSVTISE